MDNASEANVFYCIAQLTLNAVDMQNVKMEDVNKSLQLHHKPIITLTRTLGNFSLNLIQDL